MKVNPAAILLISCVSRKQNLACLAKDIYISDWFRKARQYAEASGCRWFVLSAKYGLVKPDQMIAPYNQTLNKMSVLERREWASKVFEELTLVVPEMPHVIILAGNRYREFLIRHLTDHGVLVSVPMKGLGIGKQLSWLKKKAVHPLG